MSLSIQFLYAPYGDHGKGAVIVGRLPHVVCYYIGLPSVMCRSGANVFTCMSPSTPETAEWLYRVRETVNISRETWRSRCLGRLSVRSV